MPQYRNHLDSRDGTIYPCVLMPDGKWWSVDDYRWDGSEWISPPNNYYWDATLSGARLYLRSTLALPPGTHLPTAAEWSAMVTAAGAMSNSRALRSVLGWAPTCAGDDIYGFGIIGANGRPPGIGWGGTGYAAMLLSANGVVQTVGVDGGFTIGDSSTPSDYYASVRFIVDVFNDPEPNLTDFFPPPGVYTSPQMVTLAKEGAVYTTDGSDPTDLSPKFPPALRVSSPTEIKLKMPGITGVYSFSYIIRGHPLATYKQVALFADGKAYPETITRTYNG